MRILITSIVNDVHSSAVALLLRDRGHYVDIYHGADFPARQCMSFRIEPNHHASIQISDAEYSFDFSAPDVVWNRRHVAFQMPTAVHDDDRRFVARECRTFSNALWSLAGPSAFWINPQTTAEQVRMKPLQLAAACAIGFDVPETLISNDPDEIRAFVRGLRGPAIYKSFLPAAWRTPDGNFAALFTSRVSESHLSSDESLRYCPGIFQAFVPKAYEIRATIMGRSCFAVRLNSAELPLSQIDWRRGQQLGLSGETYDLPSSVLERCFALMDKFGIVFGCFDFIVTPDDRFIFLEVNEMGQFLWVENVCPSLPILDAFCRFCESGDPRFEYRATDDRASFVNLCDSGRVQAFMEVEAAIHVAPDAWHLQDEKDVPHHRLEP